MQFVLLQSFLLLCYKVSVASASRYLTSASRYITTASRYHPRYQSRSSMLIRGVIPRQRQSRLDPHITRHYLVVNNADLFSHDGDHLIPCIRWLGGRQFIFQAIIGKVASTISRDVRQSFSEC